MRPLPRLLVATLGLLVVAFAAPARAAAPIMPLGEVRSGMRCTGLSVIRGTDITSFDVEVIDVVDAGGELAAAAILVRVSGPAVDRTGVGPGFSGSPILCPDAAGAPRTAGALAATVGEYGNRTALATPIEQVIGEPVSPRANADRPGRRARTGRRSSVPRARLTAFGRVRPLRAALTLQGLSPTLARRVLGARPGRLQVAPGGPARRFAPQPLEPGAAMGVGLASGDLALGAIGTVTYRDGDRLWGLGHPFEGTAGTGSRALLLQDAYVYDVIANPLGVEEVGTYKLAAPGHDLGTVTNDAPAAVVGRVGALPPRVQVRVRARDEERDRDEVLDVQVADESVVGSPSEASPLGLIGPLTVAQASAVVLHGTPASHSGSMCARIVLRARRERLRFCNRYAVERSPDGVATLAAADVEQALGLVEDFRFGRLRVDSVDVDVRLRRSLRQDLILGASAPRRVKPGQRIPVRLALQRVRGPRRSLTLRLRVPRSVAPGRRVLTLRGTRLDEPEDSFLAALGEELVVEEGVGDELEGPRDRDLGPRSVDELAEAVADIERFDGVRASWNRGGRGGRPALRSPEVRISGSARVTVRVVGRDR